MKNKGLRTGLTAAALAGIGGLTYALFSGDKAEKAAETVAETEEALKAPELAQVNMQNREQFELWRAATKAHVEALTEEEKAKAEEGSSSEKGEGGEAEASDTEEGVTVLGCTEADAREITARTAQTTTLLEGGTITVDFVCTPSKLSADGDVLKNPLMAAVVDESTVAITPRFFDANLDQCHQVAAIAAIAACANKAECDGYVGWGPNLYPGGQVGQDAQAIYEDCKAE